MCVVCTCSSGQQDRSLHGSFYSVRQVRSHVSGLLCPLLARGAGTLSWQSFFWTPLQLDCTTATTGCAATAALITVTISVRRAAGAPLLLSYARKCCIAAIVTCAATAALICLNTITQPPASACAPPQPTSTVRTPTADAPTRADAAAPISLAAIAQVPA